MQRLTLDDAAVLLVNTKPFVSTRSRLVLQEEFLIRGKLSFLPGVRAKPSGIQTHIPGCPIGIRIKPVVAIWIAPVDLCLRPKVRRSVKLGVLGAKSGNRIAGPLQIFSARLCRLLPEFPVVLIPQRKQLIKMRQMIGRVRKRAPRHEQNQMIVAVPHRLVRRCAVINAGLQDFFCPGVVCEYALSVAPAVGRKEQRHCKILLPVRRRSHGILRSVRLAGPGKIPRVLAFLHVHVSDRPLPDPVKLFLVIQLHAGHHAIGHSLRPCVVIARILDVAHVLAHRMINSLILRTVKHGLPDFLQPCLARTRRFFRFFPARVSCFFRPVFARARFPLRACLACTCFPLQACLACTRCIEPCCRKGILVRNAVLHLRCLLRLLNLPDIKKKIGKLAVFFCHIVKTGVVKLFENKPFGLPGKKLIAAPDHLRNQGLRSFVHRMRQQQRIPLALTCLKLHKTLSEPLHRKP